MRVKPRPRIGLLVLVAYLTAFFGVWVITGVDYADIGDSADTLLRWYVAPLAAGAVVLVVAAGLLGWWRPALTETRRAPRWTVIPAVVMFLLALLALGVKDYSDTTRAMLLLLVVGSIGVGFNEELLTRGLLVVGLRGTLTERRTWFWSTLLFGALHLPNAVFGAGPGAVLQVILAFLSGSTFYLLRRGAGSLLPAMVLHGFWDFSVFTGEGGLAVGYVNVVVGLASVVLALAVTRQDRDQPTLAPYAEAQPAAA